MIYEEQNKIINECLERTRKLIEENKQRFKDVTDFLMSHKEITEEEPVLKTARDLGICFGD